MPRLLKTPSANYNIRLTPAERAAVRVSAAAAGLTESAWVRAAACAALNVPERNPPVEDYGSDRLMIQLPADLIDRVRAVQTARRPRRAGRTLDPHRPTKRHSVMQFLVRAIRRALAAN